MPELQFKGKEFVYNHHLTVPFRPLVPDASRSIGEPSLNGNLIIHGDNLHALKALLPMYAGKVDCIYIDPPYNTGNEGWSYNDNVNSPMMKEWFSSNPINLDDMLRHDKWCAMMWPRLTLLKDLLAEDGSIFISIDDNEIHHLRMMMDEIFGAEQFSAQVTVLCNPKGRGLSKGFADTHEYVLVYSKKDSDNDFSHTKSEEKLVKDYPLTSEDGSRYRTLELRNTHRQFGRQNRQKLWYPLFIDEHTKGVSLSPGNNTIEVWPRWEDGYEGCWTWNKAKVALDSEMLVGRKVAEAWKVFRIDRAEGSRRKATTVWQDAGVQSEKGQAAFEAVMGERFTHPPKALGLLEEILSLGVEQDGLVLDCFAGSGTTAHAILSANEGDGGSRKFIVVEAEAYADRVTAERIRRVIRGYEFTGTIREDLYRSTVTMSLLQNAIQTIEKVGKIENANSERFDEIKRSIKAGELIVTGVSAVKGNVAGLGGTFTYCTLGPELDVDNILTGEAMPDYLSVAAWLFHTATGEPFDASKASPADHYLGESSAYHVWLVYKPDLAYLKSAEAALTLTLAETISKSKPTGKKHLVFAPAKYVPNHKLLPMGVEYAPLPFALYRIEKE
jgi:adenine-specific DNA-methyltransferase